MKKWKKTVCGMCAQSCGLEMEIENNRIINVRPDPDNPHSINYCCRKGRAAKYFQDHSDRLNYPLKRVGEEFVRISWDQAFKEIAERQKEIMSKYGPRATAHVGETTSATHSGAFLAGTFRGLVGTQYYYNGVGLEFMGMLWSHSKIVGPYWLEPDEDRNEVLIIWGCNSYVSHQMLNARRTIRHFSEDPNRMVITVDPRLSETARMSDMHVALRPGTDALLLRAMIALILKEGWQDQAYLDKWVSDFDKAKHWYEDFDIEGACRVAGVPYEQVRELCKILTTRKWGVHQDLGLFMNRHNTLSSFLIVTLCAVCGMLMVPGGNVIYPTYVHPLVQITDENDPAVWRTVATNHFPVVSSYPTAVLPLEIMSDHPDRLRSVFVSMSNPARSFPDSKAQEEAFSKLELMVVLDMAMTETARHAHYILPCKSPYEMPDIVLNQFNYHSTYCVQRQPVVEPEGERKESSEVWLGIIDAMGFIPPIPDSLYEAAQNKTRMEYWAELMTFISANPAYLPLIIVIVGKTLGKAMGSVNKATLWVLLMNAPPEILSAAPRAGFKPGPAMMDEVFQAVLDHPEGVMIALTDMEDPENNFKYIVHSDHKIHLFNEVMDEYIKNITPEKEEEALQPTKEFPMILSAGRHADCGHNGLMRNPETYQFRNPCTIAMNPEDAEELGVKDGQWVRVTTEGGSAEIEAELTYQTRKGYALIPHHFGFSFDGKTYGTHVNNLTSVNQIESVTGNPLWRYVPCRVEAI